MNLYIPTGFFDLPIEIQKQILKDIPLVNEKTRIDLQICVDEGRIEHYLNKAFEKNKPKKIVKKRVKKVVESTSEV